MEDLEVFELHKIKMKLFPACERFLTIQYAVQAIWRAVQDLLDRNQPADVRQSVLQFTQSLVQGQFSELGVMRAHFFRVIQSHQVEEDSQHR